MLFLLHYGEALLLLLSDIYRRSSIPWLLLLVLLLIDLSTLYVSLLKCLDGLSRLLIIRLLRFDLIAILWLERFLEVGLLQHSGLLFLLK